ncbi:MAG: cytochrome o ubiquinol oxidase subunit III [Candidatus Yonathbacteria bacterium RIFCSPHIGHO2_01_FULL_44_41]|uniref:Cytochrome bo(3) ubiquinol oxidase subunit 3 n=1 Tax=Candidatus Yonathbacteria bacterium RIFCSPHIGHO2_02_FULL_44_14 TaxID=1802724 RepID=A0A1G2S741_9BACT|nr:MAG: cytochrome o ubiquinol oxidase subunit III [Candidatus Yonathbacteria bacterium RIFCSPHIGHO2_01_FULL_44_41]OHA80509.1 MAG: cytochrome o ubiquinol oxidase subunit III [Candidatus Yonathbacteria bacterium RIFCSPHIGHO2_02_FULL_44_14]OHA82201.1 MAG: cytochrome o ubiquinol oxidase subunit III [Candidatus Yonathbacteria bacterium RIFCSPLOWO2_01_FULL_43_20]
MSTEILAHHKEHHRSTPKSLFGFWVYIMSDALLFASIFATYAVLRNNTYGGPSAGELFSMPFVLTETLILLASSFTYGLASLYAHHHNSKRKVLAWLLVTFLLGALFLGMEISEFTKLVSEGNGWQRSGFLSAFFTLVGTHGLHVTAGLVWMGGLIIQVLYRGITEATMSKISVLGLFWHFLDIVWIFIFTFVYLIGAI